MELENKPEITTPEQPKEPPKPDTALPSDPPPAAEQPFDITAYEKEFDSTGALSEASYKALEARGLPKHMVDSYIAGQQAKAATTLSDIHASAGGADQFTNVMTWAESALTADEKQTYNSIVQSKDIGAIKIAISGLAARYQLASGAGKQPANQQITNTSAPSGVEGYESMAQMVRDMSNPLYKSDPAYRAKVEKKASVSRF